MPRRLAEYVWAGDGCEELRFSRRFGRHGRLLRPGRIAKEQINGVLIRHVYFFGDLFEVIDRRPVETDRDQALQAAADALGEDNRYLPSGRSGASARLRHAIESSFLARKSDGTRPQASKPRFCSEVGFNVAREFLPKLFRRH